MQYHCVNCQRRYEFRALKKGVHALCPECHGDLQEMVDADGPTLTLTFPGGQTRTFHLKTGFTVGRDSTCDVVLEEDSISGVHARFSVQHNGAVSVADSDSTNGVRVNGVRVDLQTLRDGDRIKFGRVEATFRNPRGPISMVADVAVLHSEGATGIDAEYSPSRTMLVEADSGISPDAEKALRLQRALEMTADLAIIHDPQALLTKLAESVFELFRTDRTVVLLRNPDRRTFSVAMARSADGSTPEGLTLSRTLMRKVVGEKTAIATSDARTDDRLISAASIVAAGTRSAIVAPLLHRDEVLGLVWTDTLSETRRFGEGDLRIFTGLLSVVAVAMLNVKLYERVAAEARVRSHLSRYLSPDVVQSVMEQKLTLQMGGELCDATVLFSDVRGFTAASEKMEPRQVVDLLNRYFERMVEVVFRNGGTVDKFIGDAIMAVWGVPQPKGNHALGAVRAALEMQRSLVEFNLEQRAQGLPEVGMGIGIHTGQVVAGNIGSSRRMEFTVIGDTVNTASRIESSTGTGDIFVSRETYNLLEGRIAASPLPPIRVKNKAEPLALFAVDPNAQELSDGRAS